MENLSEILMLSLVGRALGLAPCACLSKELPEELFTDETRPAFIEAVKLAKKHDIAHLVCHAALAMGAFKGGSLESAMNKELILAHMRYENLSHELGSVCGCLSNAQIPHMPLKGSVLRALYPEPWMRSSCDIDVLVPDALLDKAENALVTELGYERGERGGHDVVFTSKSGVHVELHFGTVEEGRAARSRDLLKDIWLYAHPEKEGSYTYRLTDAMFYFYHIAHMAKHFENGGSGVRSFMDMIILENAPDIDPEGRAELLERGGLADFERECMLLAKRWFCSESACDQSGVHFTEVLSAFILSGGAFGTIENMVAVNQTKKGSRGGYILSRLFMPYSRMKLIYPVLERHKWLFPFYQVVRWLRVIKDKRVGRSLAEAKNSGRVSKADSDNARIMLDRLGL